MRLSSIWKIYFGVSILAVIVLCLPQAWGADEVGTTPALAATWIGGTALVLAFVLILVWWFRLLCRALEGFGESLKVAIRPVPSPAEICVALENEWGRVPSVQEISAVHQMLHDRHNEALIESGIGIGAAYLLIR